MAPEMSPLFVDMHQAPLRVPPAPPVERQCVAAPISSSWPSLLLAAKPPTTPATTPLEHAPSTSGLAYPGLAPPSIRRPAMPITPTCGPRAHQSGSTPALTRVGLQENVW